jgi:hypothetical protein
MIGKRQPPPPKRLTINRVDFPGAGKSPLFKGKQQPSRIMRPGPQRSKIEAKG